MRVRVALLGLAAAGALALGSGAANADGYSAPVRGYAAPFSWSGFYVGGNVGVLDGDIDGHFVAPVGGFNISQDSTAIAGVHAGIQHQFGNIVLGVETGYGWNLNRDFSTTSPGAACDVVAPFVCEGRINNIWQIGPRLGVAFDRFMLYGTGGYAQGSITSRIRNTATNVNFDSLSGRHDGWFAGAGMEYAFHRNVIVGVEYMHYDLGSETYTSVAPAENRSLDVNADVVRARLTFKFGRDEVRPVPLK